MDLSVGEGFAMDSVWFWWISLCLDHLVVQYRGRVCLETLYLYCISLGGSDRWGDGGQVSSKPGSTIWATWAFAQGPLSCEGPFTIGPLD